MVSVSDASFLRVRPRGESAKQKSIKCLAFSDIGVSACISFFASENTLLDLKIVRKMCLISVISLAEDPLRLSPIALIFRITAGLPSHNVKGAISCVMREYPPTMAPLPIRVN